MAVPLCCQNNVSDRFMYKPIYPLSNATERIVNYVLAAFQIKCPMCIPCVITETVTKPYSFNFDHIFP